MKTHLNLRALVCFSGVSLLLASCLLPRLKVDENASGGASNGGSVAADAGRTSSTGGESRGGSVSFGGTSSQAGSSNGDAGNNQLGGASSGGTGGVSSGGSGGSPNGGSPSDGSPSGGSPSGGAGGAPSNPLLAVKKTTGCGQSSTLVPGAATKQTIQTMGTKAAACADGACGAWMYLREYYVTLPIGYDKNKAYPLIFQGPGCAGAGTDVYPLTGPAANVNGTVIRVGLTPPPDAIQHSTNPGQRCFDDKEGDDSVDFVFYENLRDLLKTQLCYDENRVFASGSSSGAFLANELGCKYAGNTQGYAIRGVLANTGGLPTQPPFAPTCSNQPMSGMWVHEVGDTTTPFSGNKEAINRAMLVNGCSGTSYDTATFQPYAIGGTVADGTCKLIQGCPAIYPLVVCPLPGNAHGSHDNVANPGFSTFLTMFSNAPFVN